MFRPSFIRRLIRENLARASATAIRRERETPSSVNDPPPAPLILPVDFSAVSPSGDGPSHVRLSCAVPPSRADPSTDLSPLARSIAHPRPEEASVGPSRDSRSHEPPNALHTEDHGHPYARHLCACDMPAHAMGTAGRSVPVVSHDMTRLARSVADPPPSRPGESPALRATRDHSESSTLNIYSDDVLPQSSPAGSAPLPDTQWAGYDKEVINVMMPVDLYGCFLILLSAPHLRKIQFWRINGNRNSGKWPELEVRELESLIIRDTEMQIKKLLDCLRIRDLQELEVYYASQCGHNFIADRASYRKLFDSRRHLPLEGRIRIVPNDPKYSGRSSSLERRLKESLRGKEWDIGVTDHLF